MTRETTFPYEVLALDPDMIKPVDDENEYMLIRLPNGLRVVIGSYSAKADRRKLSEKELSAETDPTALAIILGAGSGHDPPTLEGTAHLMEHLVFMSNDRFPKPNELDRFLAENNGSCNAVTQLDRMSFHLGCVSSEVPEMLDRFSACIITPRFRPQDMAAETAALDNEFSETRSNFENQIEFFLKSLYPKGHPQAKFNFGNADTLNIRTEAGRRYAQSELKRFYGIHVYGTNMTLAMVTPLPKLYAASLIAQYFSDLPAEGLTGYAEKGRLTGNLLPTVPDFHRFYMTNSAARCHIVKLIWSLSPQLSNYMTRPLDYFASILDNEGPGSLADVLIQKGFITELCTSGESNTSEENDHSTHFTLEVSLTEKGLKEVNRVIRSIFYFLNLVRNAKPSSKFYADLARCREVQFHAAEEPTTLDKATELAFNLMLFDNKMLLSGRQLMYEFNASKIQEVAAELDPALCMVIMSSPTVEEMALSEKDVVRETLTGLKLRQRPFKTSDWLSSDHVLVREFRYPKVNKYVPIKSSPRPILDHGQLVDLPVDSYRRVDRLVFGSNARFENLKGVISLHLLFDDDLDKHLINACKAGLTTTLFLRMINAEVYTASHHGLSVSVGTTQNGFEIIVDGLTDHLIKLLRYVLTALVQLPKKMKQDPAVFENVKEATLETYTKINQMVYNMQENIFNTMAMPKSYKNLERCRATVRDMPQDHLGSFIAEAIDRIKVEIFVKGNFIESDARKVARLVDEVLDSKTGRKAKKVRRVVRNVVHKARKIVGSKKTKTEKVRHSFIRNPDVAYQIPQNMVVRILNFDPCEENNHIFVRLQNVANTARNRVMLDLLVTFLQEPAYNTLRTKEELAYTISLAVETDLDEYITMSVSIVSQGDLHTCAAVRGRVVRFLQTKAVGIIAKLEKDLFNDIVKLGVASKDFLYDNLEDEAAYEWKAMVKMSSEDPMAAEGEQLAILDFKEFKEWCINLLRGPFQSVEVCGRAKASLDECDPVGTYLWDVDREEVGEQVKFVRKSPVSRAICLVPNRKADLDDDDLDVLYIRGEHDFQKGRVAVI